MFKGLELVDAVDLPEFLLKYDLNSSSITKQQLNQARQRVIKSRSGRDEFATDVEKMKDIWFLTHLCRKADANESDAMTQQDVYDLAKPLRLKSMLEVREIENDPPPPVRD